MCLCLKCNKEFTNTDRATLHFKLCRPCGDAVISRFGRVLSKPLTLNRIIVKPAVSVPVLSKGQQRKKKRRK